MGASETKLTPKEEARQNKRMIDRAARQLNRESKKLEQEQAKAKNQIKKLAKEGKHGPAKILVKQSVRFQRQIQQYIGMTAQLKTISMQLGTMHMNATLMDALRKATKTMKKVGEDIDMKELQKTLKEYQKESMKMEAKSDMMADAMDDGDGDLESEVDNEYNKVLTEVGLELDGEGPAIPAGKPAVKVAAPVEEAKDADLDDLESRLKNI